MTPEQFKKLVVDIKKQGQLEPILTYKGRIIDGRHRFKACMKLGIEPKTEEWTGEGSLVEFVVSRNLHRRHLNASQRAAIANQMKPMMQREAKSRQKAGASKGGKARAANQKAAKEGKRKSALSQKEIAAKHREEFKKEEVAKKGQKASEAAGKMVNVSGRQVEYMSKIEKEAPALVKPIRDGSLSVNQARKIVSLPAPERKIVLDRGKSSGDYGSAYKEHESKKKKKPKQTPITKTELHSALKGAAESAKACEGHLKAADDISKKLKVHLEKNGRGMQALVGTLTRCLNGIDKMTE